MNSCPTQVFFFFCGLPLEPCFQLQLSCTCMLETLKVHLMHDSYLFHLLNAQGCSHTKWLLSTAESLTTFAVILYTGSLVLSNDSVSHFLVFTVNRYKVSFFQWKMYHSVQKSVHACLRLFNFYFLDATA